MSKKKIEYVSYEGRRINKEHFRVFVYNKDGEMLVNSYEEYLKAINSKKWFSNKAEIPAVKPKKVKPDDTDSERICN